MQDFYSLLGISSSASVKEIESAIQKSRELHQMAQGSGDEQVASRATFMLAEIDQAEKALLGTAQTRADAAEQIGGSLWSNLQKSSDLLHNGKRQEAFEIIRRLQLTYPDRSIETALARLILSDARAQITYDFTSGNQGNAFIDGPEAVDYVTSRLNDLQALNVDDPSILSSIENMKQLLKTARTVPPKITKKCLSLFLQGRGSEALAMIDSVQSSYPQSSVKTLVSKQLLADARKHLLHFDNSVLLTSREATEYVQMRVQDLKMLQPQDLGVRQSIDNLHSLVQDAQQIRYLGFGILKPSLIICGLLASWILFANDMPGAAAIALLITAVVTPIILRKVWVRQWEMNGKEIALTQKWDLPL